MSDKKLSSLIERKYVNGYENDEKNYRLTS